MSCHQGSTIGTQDPACLLRHGTQEAGVAALFPSPFPRWRPHPGVHYLLVPALEPRAHPPAHKTKHVLAQLSQIISSSFTQKNESPCERHCFKCPVYGAARSWRYTCIVRCPVEMSDIKGNKAEGRDEGKVTGKRRGLLRAELPTPPNSHVKSSGWDCIWKESL